MAEEKLIVCSVPTVAQMLKIVEDNFDKDRYTVYSWKSGEMSSLPQKALLHIWLKQWIAHIYRKKEKDVTEQEIEDFKRKAKSKYYFETGESFVMAEVYDVMAPTKRSLQPTSIADWDQGECFHFMEWMQLKAADGGLILESKGEHKKLKQEQYGR